MSSCMYVETAIRSYPVCLARSVVNSEGRVVSAGLCLHKTWSEDRASEDCFQYPQSPAYVKNKEAEDLEWYDDTNDE